MSLSIEQQLTRHELEDERRFGKLETHLSRIEGKIDVLAVQVIEARTKADSASDEVEETGRHRAYTAEKSADFWKKIIAGIVSALIVSAVVGATGYIIGKQVHTAGVHP